MSPETVRVIAKPADQVEVHVTSEVVRVVVPPPAPVVVATALAQGPAGPRGPAGSGSGGGSEILTALAGETLSAHRLVALDELGRLVYSRSTDAVGLSLVAALEGSQATFQGSGVIEEVSWSWTPGKPLYQTGTGILTQTIPTTGFVRQVAMAITPQSILLDLQPPTILAT